MIIHGILSISRLYLQVSSHSSSFLSGQFKLLSNCVIGNEKELKKNRKLLIKQLKTCTLTVKKPEGKGVQVKDDQIFYTNKYSLRSRSSDGRRIQYNIQITLFAFLLVGSQESFIIYGMGDVALEFLITFAHHLICAKDFCVSLFLPKDSENIDAFKKFSPPPPLTQKSKMSQNQKTLNSSQRNFSPPPL